MNAVTSLRLDLLDDAHGAGLGEIVGHREIFVSFVSAPKPVRPASNLRRTSEWLGPSECRQTELVALLPGFTA